MGTEATSERTSLEKDVIDALKTIYDPEIPVDIYSLGLIYEVTFDDKPDVYIKMTLTTPFCPVAESLPMEVQERVSTVEGIVDAHVEVTWDPPWTKDMMSEEAKFALDML
jgi:FeS assembly SUF system protein